MDIPKKKKDAAEEILKALAQENDENEQVVMSQPGSFSNEIIGQLRKISSLNIQGQDRIQARLPYLITIK